MLKKLTRCNTLYHYEENNQISSHPADLQGDCSDLQGDCSDLRGDLDECELTEEERETCLSIHDLVS